VSAASRIVSFAGALAALAFALPPSARAQEPEAPPPAAEEPPPPQAPEPPRVVPPYPPFEYRVVYGALPPEPPRSEFSAKLWAGPGYQHFLDLGMYNGTVGASVGAQKGISSGYAEFQAVLGRTDHGLSTYQGWIGGSWEGTIDRFRLGLGMHFGFLGIKRATTGDLMAAMGVGPFAFATFDLLQYEERRALYVGARFEANWIDAAGGPSLPWLFGPSATLGWRY
jgi:hypothetical protein